MSFNQEVKNEIIAKGKKLAGPQLVAHCYGIACFAKYFDERGLIIHTEQEAFATYVFGHFAALNIIGTVTRRSKGGFEYAVKEKVAVEMLHSTLNFTKEDASLHLATALCTGYESAFFAGCFLTGGFINNPEKGYLLEFNTPRYNFAGEFAAYLSQNGFTPRRSVRKSQYMVYFKASEQVEDLLTLMGAVNNSFAVMNSKIVKDIRNNANRITNCETANIEKTIEATKRSLESIAFLEEQGAFTRLAPAVQQLAILRKNNPDLPLIELGALCEPPIGKSGVSHRLRKIEDAAKALRERKTNG